MLKIGPQPAPTRTTQRGNTVYTAPNAKGWKIEVSPEFERVAKRFKLDSPVIMATTMRSVIVGLQKMAQKTMRNNLMSMVYMNDLPESVTSGKITRSYYLEVMRRRKGLMHDAVQIDKPALTSAKVWTGKTYIKSMSDLERYYYANVLNFGHQGSPQYEPRPYFDRTKVTMLAFIGVMAAKGLNSARDKLQGKLGIDLIATEAL